MSFDARDVFFKQRKILRATFEHRGNQSSAEAQLFYQWRRYLDTRCGDSDAIVGALLWIPQPPVSPCQNDISVACLLEIPSGKLKGHRIYFDGDNHTPWPHNFSRNSRSITRSQTDFEKPMALIQTQRLVE